VVLPTLSKPRHPQNLTPRNFCARHSARARHLTHNQPHGCWSNRWMLKPAGIVRSSWSSLSHFGHGRPLSFSHAISTAFGALPYKSRLPFRRPRRSHNLTCIFANRRFFAVCARTMASETVVEKHEWSAVRVRDTFLDYFKKNGHTFGKKEETP
jgi:hypothetical protein